MSITTSTGLTIVDFKINSVHGAPALGAYQLKFSLDYAMPNHDEELAYFHNTLAKVYVGPNSTYLGKATPEVPKTYRPNLHPQNGAILYEILLTANSLDEIEKIRTGGDLDFKLDISGEYYDGYNRLCNTVSVTFKANQKSWIDTLKNMKHKSSVIFELPMDTNENANINTALEAIEKAKEHLYYGNYDDVIAKCRISLESIISSWGEISALRKASMDKANRKEMSKELRFFNIIDQICHFTHLAHHPDVNNEYISFTRSEAVFILGATITAIASYSQQVSH